MGGHRRADERIVVAAQRAGTVVAQTLAQPGRVDHVTEQDAPAGRRTALVHRRTPAPPSSPPRTSSTRRPPVRAGGGHRLRP